VDGFGAAAVTFGWFWMVLRVCDGFWIRAGNSSPRLGALSLVSVHGLRWTSPGADLGRAWGMIPSRGLLGNGMTPGLSSSAGQQEGRKGPVGTGRRSCWARPTEERALLGQAGG
ncbi:hypothetical protein Drorol1_Dr00002145, partial [Drosera rotundifolia]